MVIPPLALAAVLAGAVLHAAWNVGIRSRPDRHVSTAELLLGAAALAVVCLPFLPPPLPASYLFLVASTPIHVVYFSLLAEAYARVDIALAYPVMRGVAPTLTALVAVGFLGERLGPKGWFGVLLISAGVALMARHSRAQGERPALFIALGNAVLIAGYTVVDALGARTSGSPVAYVLWLLLLTALPACAILLRGQRWRGFVHADNVPAAALRGLGGGLFSVASYSLALWALTRAPIGPIAALRETSTAFSVLLAWLWLGEWPSARRWIAVATIAAGAIALRLQ